MTSGVDTVIVLFVTVPGFPWRKFWLWPVWLFLRAVAACNQHRVSHVSVSDGECVVSPGFLCYGRKYHSHIKYLHLDILRATASFRGRVSVTGRRGITCVSDVRRRLADAGVPTRWCLTPAGLLRQLERRQDVRVLVRQLVSH